MKKKPTDVDTEIELLWGARQIIEKNPNLSHAAHAARLRRKFHLTSAEATALIAKTSDLISQGVVIPRPSPNPRFIADHCFATPRDELPTSMPEKFSGKTTTNSSLEGGTKKNE